MTTRQTVPDWIKGVMITLMVYGHVTSVGLLAGHQRGVVDAVYTFHMPIFLMMSGYFSSNRYTLTQACRRLFRRLVVPYVIFLSLYLIGLLLVGNVGIPTSNRPPGSVGEFIWILTIQPRGAYWFIHSLVLLQACVILGSSLGSRLRLAQSKLSPVVILLLAAVCYLDLLSPRVATYYLLGVVLGELRVDLPKSVGAGFLMMGMLILFFYRDIANFSYVQIAWCLSVLTFSGGVAQFFASSRSVGVFTWLGRNSLLILLFHALFIVALKPLAGVCLAVESTGLLFSLTTTVVAVLGSLVVGAVFDKMRLSIYIFSVDGIYSPRSPTDAVEYPQSAA